MLLINAALSVIGETAPNLSGISTSPTLMLLDSLDAPQVTRNVLEQIRTPTMSQRDRNGDGVWIPALRDCGGITEESGEVLFDLQLVDQVLQELPRPAPPGERVGQRRNPPDTLLSSGGGRSRDRGTVVLISTM